MPFVKQDLHTVDEIEKLPEGERAELVDGVLYDLAVPTRVHQRIVSVSDRGCEGAPD